MNRNVLIALILIALATVVMIFSSERVVVDLVFTKIRPIGSLVYLAFTALGVVIGVLLK